MFLFYTGLENNNNQIIDIATEDMKTSLKVIYVMISAFYVMSIIIAYTIFFYTIYFIIVIISFPFKLYPIKLLFGFYDSILYAYE